MLLQNYGVLELKFEIKTIEINAASILLILYRYIFKSDLLYIFKSISCNKLRMCQPFPTLKILCFFSRSKLHF